MKARLLKNEMGDEPLIAGTVVSGAEAYILVEIGKAKPADEECLAMVKKRGKVKAESYLLADLVLVKDEPIQDKPVVADKSKGQANESGKTTAPRGYRATGEDAPSVG